MTWVVGRDGDAGGQQKCSAGRGPLSFEEFEPLVVGESESNVSAGYRSLEFQEVLVGNGLPNAEKVVPACDGPGRHASSAAVPWVAGRGGDSQGQVFSAGTVVARSVGVNG